MFDLLLELVSLSGEFSSLRLGEAAIFAGFLMSSPILFSLSLLLSSDDSDDDEIVETKELEDKLLLLAIKGFCSNCGVSWYSLDNLVLFRISPVGEMNKEFLFDADTMEDNGLSKLLESTFSLILYGISTFLADSSLFP